MAHHSRTNSRLERVYLSEKHHSHHRMRQLVREGTQPFQVFLENSNKSYNKITSHTHTDKLVLLWMGNQPLYDWNNLGNTYGECGSDKWIGEDAEHSLG